MKERDKAILHAGYHGRRGKQGRRRVTIQQLTTTKDGIEVAQVTYDTGNEPPRWVAVTDLSPI